MIRRRFAAVALTAMLFGCASSPDDPRNDAEAVAPLTCASKEQCDAYWQRAQAWVGNNSGYRIRLANDTIIETFGPFGSKVDLAYRITRVPEGNNGARIFILPACDNIFGCYPTRTEAIKAFKRFVRG